MVICVMLACAFFFLSGASHTLINIDLQKGKKIHSTKAEVTHQPGAKLKPLSRQAFYYTSE